MGQTSNGVLEFSVSVWGLTSQWTLKDLVSQSNDHDFIMVVLANSFDQVLFNSTPLHTVTHLLTSQVLQLFLFATWFCWGLEYLSM